MEENKENGPENQAAENSSIENGVQEVPKAETSVETVSAKTEEQTATYRRNGRNRSGRAASNGGSAASSSEMCGEISDVSSFTEKLSGKNIKGYGDEARGERGERGERNERNDRGERGERGERDRFNRRDRDRGERRERPFRPEFERTEAESAAPEAEGETSAEAVHSGPAFEEKRFTPRAIEVGLTDRRPAGDRHDKSADGVVSFTPEDCASPSISLFARIKEIIKSIFGRKSEPKRDFRNGGKKNWNNNRDRNFRNGDRRDRRGKPGDRHGNNHRRFDDRRPRGGQNRGPNGGGDSK